MYISQGWFWLYGQTIASYYIFLSRYAVVTLEALAVSPVKRIGIQDTALGYYPNQNKRCLKIGVEKAYAVETERTKVSNYFEHCPSLPTIISTSIGQVIHPATIKDTRVL